MFDASPNPLIQSSTNPTIQRSKLTLQTLSDKHREWLGASSRERRENRPASQSRIGRTLDSKAPDHRAARLRLHNSSDARFLQDGAHAGNFRSTLYNQHASIARRALRK